jgi:cell division protein FtsA
VLLQGTSEFAEEILGMPVRIGMPTGIKGITQLVHGPEYSTGVGLVKFGAQSVFGVLGESATQMPSIPAPAPRSRLASQSSIVEIAEARRSGFWEWIKAAF